MKVTVPGKTPLERLTEFTKRVLDVSKDDVQREEKKWRKGRRKTIKRSLP
jgi:hypothetical protein